MQDGKTRVTVALDADLLDQVDALGQNRDRVIEKMIRRELRWAGRRRKDREIRWFPDWITLKARELQLVAEHLETSRRAFEVDPRFGLSRGMRYAAPILRTLATEIALKAWQIREREGGLPDQNHDLVELFDALSDDAQERLEAFQTPSHPLGAEAVDPCGMVGMRQVLEFHRNAFEAWRYPYEAEKPLFIASPQLDAALTAIIETYNVFCSKALEISLTDHQALSLADPSDEVLERLSAGVGVPVDDLLAVAAGSGVGPVVGRTRSTRGNARRQAVV